MEVVKFRPLVELAGGIGYSPKNDPAIYIYRNPLTYSTKRWELWVDGKCLGDFPTLSACKSAAVEARSH